MATVKAKNPVTGKEFDVSEAEFSSNYQPLGWTMSSPSTTPAPVQSSTPDNTGNQANSSQTTEMFYKDGSKNAVPTFDVDHWKNQGWSTDAPSEAPAKQVDTGTTPKVEDRTQDPSIQNLVNSGQVFNEVDAKNFAFAKGDDNWQQYVGGTSGKANPLYIGATNWANIQKAYTPYQIQQSTVRTKDGIYWNPNVNIAEIQRVDPSTQINNDAAAIAKIISDAKKGAEKYDKDDGKIEDVGLDENSGVNEDNLMSMLQGQYGNTAESLYKELFDTDEIKNAQEDVNKYKEQLDDYEDQIDELRADIRKEVEGEASESYISALATIRGGDILKQQKIAQRSYDTALSILKNARQQATDILNVRMHDNDNRYNRMFSMLQLQIQQEGTQFNQQMALLSAAQQMPKGRSITLPDGSVITGMDESSNLNVVQFTDANRKVYVIGVDKATGKEIYRTAIGTAPSSGGSTPEFSYEKALREYNAQQGLEYQQEIDAKLKSGDAAIGYDDKNNAFYYDPKALKSYNDGRNFLQKKKKEIDFRI